MPTVRLIIVRAGKSALIDLVTGQHLDGTQHWPEEEIAAFVRPYIEKYLAAYPPKREAAAASGGEKEGADAAS